MIICVYDEYNTTHINRKNMSDRAQNAKTNVVVYLIEMSNNLSLYDIIQS